jgi:hypothetical protein
LNHQELENFGSHSIKKGVVMYASNGTPHGSCWAAFEVRVRWKQSDSAKMAQRHIKFEPAGGLADYKLVLLLKQLIFKFFLPDSKPQKWAQSLPCLFWKSSHGRHEALSSFSFDTITFIMNFGFRVIQFSGVTLIQMFEIWRASLKSVVIDNSDNNAEPRGGPITVKVLQECQEPKEERRAVFEVIS